MSSTDTYPGLLHSISPPLVAFEHRHNPQSQASNTLIFLGGLADGLLTVPYVPHIQFALPSSWALVETTLSSSYRQFGIASLGEDVAEIARLVEYFHTLHPKGKIVLLGHSTGSQQIMHYSIAPGSRPTIDGALFQASASDREALASWLSADEYQSACAVAQSYISEGRGEDVLPFEVTASCFQTAPLSASRWISLASPGDHEGEDDYFSSDFDDERLSKIFGELGKTGKRIGFLYSGSDQYVPSTVDKSKLVENWHEHVRRGGGIIDEGSGIVRGASHTLKEGGEPLENLVGRVIGFLERLEKEDKS
ncbi:hypothetical protein HO173_002990 [Letharia columbiana]|uniref:DUF1749-domain-containing protein n=1 Tax=Letharia columbiana TaxID=112416 RepID=A0A8H6L860_9LECA|nr:uncharacterized protein HO173_002990 [Letharia columbiana]KAF6239118.1 hypothetical protein HO173_002990 [Letharia columbiana]